MKKNQFLFPLLLVLLSHFPIVLCAQIFSEAPVIISEKGQRLSNMIYVKTKFSGLVKIPADKKEVDGDALSNEFSDVRKVIFNFCKDWQIDLPKLKITKAIPNAGEDDTLFTDTKTGEIKKLPNFARVFIIKFPKQVDIETIISELEKNAKVEYAHGPVQLVNCAENPNDTYFSNGGQWYLNTIKAPEAWSITKGNSDTKIALIEAGGVELSHFDLQSKIVGGDNNPGGITSRHGTWVAGFAGAVTNNSTGVASLGWNIKLLTYQPTDDDDNRNVLAQKIKDAADAGAHVISLSFKTLKTGFTSCAGTTSIIDGSTILKNNEINSSMLTRSYYYNWDYSLVRDAITYAVGKNSVVVVAAGNTNNAIFDDFPCENVPYPCYPAQYSNVIAVSGSMQNNNFVDGWNYGSFVDVNAAGKTDANTGLWSTDTNNSYTNDVNKTSGTSFATPQVSALSALIKSLDVTLSPNTVGNIIKNSTDKVGQYSYDLNGYNQYMGFGRINAYNALLLSHAYSSNNPKSISQIATSGNSQRKVVQDASGNYHVVFSSGGEIFYRKYVSGTWQDPVKISCVNGSNDYPSIAVCSSSQIILTWQRNTGTNTYDIYFALSTNSGSTWSSSYKYTVQTSVSSTVNPMPVLAGNNFNGRKTILFTASDGLKSRTTTETNPLSQNDWTLQTVVSSNYIQNPTVSHNDSYMIASYQNTSDNHGL